MFVFLTAAQLDAWLSCVWPTAAGEKKDEQSLVLALLNVRVLYCQFSLFSSLKSSISSRIFSFIFK